MAKLRNIDMATQCGGDESNTNVVNWIHSYFISQPVSDTWKLYGTMKVIINQENKESNNEN